MVQCSGPGPHHCTVSQALPRSAELKQISKTNDKLLHERRAAKQESVKRSRDEQEALAACKEPCLCTREGAATLLAEAHHPRTN